MKYPTTFLILLLLLLPIFASAQDKQDRETGAFQPRVYNSPQGGMLPYRLFIPKNADPKGKYPLVLFLHGAGERGMDNRRQVRDILNWSKDSVQAKYPCYIVAPQCPNWREVFQVYGNNTDQSITTYRDYTPADGWKHYTIPVGRAYTGKMNWMFFFNDDWGKDSKIESLFRNVKVYETGQAAKTKPLHFTPTMFMPYAGGGRGFVPLLEDSGTTLHFTGDTRRKIVFPYAVTKNTLLEFDFKSSVQGNVHGIGLDDDDTLFDYRWVQVDWSSQSHVLPKEPSQPLRMTLELLPMLEKEFPSIDARRLYVTGLSMGGYGTWDLLARRPDLFAAAIPICGGADLDTAYTLARIPVWAFHGQVDGVVPPDRSRTMIAALWNVGGKSRYSEYPGIGHDSWTKAYWEPELLPWLFAQKRDVTPPTTPANLKVTLVGASRVNLTWNESHDPESGVREYKIYRDGGEIGTTTGTHFTDTEFGESEVHNYTVKASNNWWLESAPCEQAWAKIPADTFPPVIASVQALGGPSTIEVKFSKPVEARSAANEENYQLDNGLAVGKVVLNRDERTVTLTAPGLVADRKYTLTIRSVKDRAAHPNTLAANSQAAFVYDPCLAGLWRFDEGESNIALDSSGNDNSAAIRSPDWVRGKFGKALSFDGQWEHIVWARQNSNLELTDSLTVALWVKKGLGQVAHQILIAKHHYYDHRTNFVLDFDESQQLRVIAGTTGKGEIVVKGTRLDARDWHHVAFTYGNNSLELYVDGVSQGKTEGGGKLVSVSEPITIGGGHQGRDPFKGALDEVRVYNRALNAEEIKSLATTE